MSDQEFASFLMYPKVFTDYAAAVERYGPVSALPTPVYFYGLEQGEEILVEIEKGKALVIRNLGRGEVDDKGMVTVFFELNGQPRSIKIIDRHHASSEQTKQKADIGNANHLGSPMPGVISQILVKVGDKVKAGDELLSIEAMKMETALHAEKDATIAEILVRPAEQIDTKDLLLVFS